MNKLQVGQEAFGGIVFHVDESGYKGLVCSVNHIQDTYTWDEANRLAETLDENGYDDWTLPSKKDLSLLYQNIHQAGLFDFGGGFYWGEEYNSGAGWTIHFERERPGKTAGYTKYGHYKGRVIPVRKITGSKYVIEMLGRQGRVEFPTSLESKPLVGTLTLLDNNGQDDSIYHLANGEWKGDQFLVDVVEADNPSQAADLPGANGNHLKLKASDSGFAFVGAIGKSRESDSWASSVTHVIVGYEESHPIVKSSNQTPLFTLVVNDKHADKKWDQDTQKYLDTYSYGWYINPKTAVGDNFRMVHIVIDDLLEEVALYAFDNAADRQSHLSQFKLYSYSTKKIQEELKTLYPQVSDYTLAADVRADLGALLINKAQLMFPSRFLGLKSSGHGSPTGIMNGFFKDQAHIRSALSAVKGVRGKNIDFLDFITNCNVASLYNLSAVADYVDYVTASDLTRMSPVEYIPVDSRPSSNYISYFQNEAETVPQILSAMVNKWGELFNGEPGQQYAREHTMTAKSRNGYEQQITLFDMKKLQTVLTHLGGDELAYTTCNQKAQADASALSSTVYYDHNSPYYSFAKAIPILFPEYQSFASDYKAAIVAQVDNRQQFDWGDQKDIPTGVILARKTA